MALFVIQHVLIDNYPGAGSCKAGMAVMLTTSGGVETVTAADRGTATNRFFGVLGDDTTTSGNTQFVIDPVSPGNYSHDTTAGDDPADYEGPDAVAKPARRLGDYMDERITNTNNWTDYPSDPKRGVTVYRHGGRFRTDQYETANTANGGGATATANVAGVPVYTVGTMLTFSSTASSLGTAGLWVAGDATTCGNTGVVARVVKPAAVGGAIEIAIATPLG